jgi:hypothetical protein
MAYTRLCAALLGLTVVVPVAVAQFPPRPENVTVIDSRFGDGVKISYKQVSHVHLPLQTPCRSSPPPHPRLRYVKPRRGSSPMLVTFICRQAPLRISMNNKTIRSTRFSGSSKPAKTQRTHPYRYGLMGGPVAAPCWASLSRTVRVS